MPLWDKLKTELDRAGRAAQSALDEGKLRLEIFRTRQLADKAAQALGYSVYRSKQNGAELEPDVLGRLIQAVAEREAEVKRLEDQLRAKGGTPPGPDEQPPPGVTL